MTVPQESYSELKERTNAEFARETLLYNLKKLAHVCHLILETCINKG